MVNPSRFTDISFTNRLQLYSHADSDADANTDMPIPRFRSGRFPGFCQFRMEKKELALEIKKIV